MGDSDGVEKAVHRLETALETEERAEKDYLIREALHLLAVEEGE